MDMEGHVISQLAGELVEQFEANQARRFCEGESWGLRTESPRHGSESNRSKKSTWKKMDGWEMSVLLLGWTIFIGANYEF